jgi:hypothetical protein
MVAAAVAAEVELTWPGLWSPHPATKAASSSISGLKKLPDLDMCFSWALQAERDRRAADALRPPIRAHGAEGLAGFWPRALATFPLRRKTFCTIAHAIQENPVSRQWHIPSADDDACTLPYKSGNCGFRLRAGASLIKTPTALIEPCKST